VNAIGLYVALHPNEFDRIRLGIRVRQVRLVVCSGFEEYGFGPDFACASNGFHKRIGGFNGNIRRAFLVLALRDHHYRHLRQTGHGSLVCVLERARQFHGDNGRTARQNVSAHAPGKFDPARNNR